MRKEEEIWLERTQQGEPQAFEYLVETYQHPVYNLCYRMLGNSQDAEDAAQETFLRAYKAIRRYDPCRSFSTWLLSIAAHYCIDHMRRWRTNIISTEELVYEDLTDNSPTPEAGLNTKEQQAFIQSIIQALDPVDRAAVVMYYWYDFSYDEICQALSLTQSALKSRLHRARKTLTEEWLRRQSEFLEKQKKIPSETLLVERMAI